MPKIRRTDKYILNKQDEIKRKKFNNKIKESKINNKIFFNFFILVHNKKIDDCVKQSIKNEE